MCCSWRLNYGMQGMRRFEFRECMSPFEENTKRENLCRDFSGRVNPRGLVNMPLQCECHVAHAQEAAELARFASAGCGEATQAKHHLDMGRKKKKKDEGELSLNPLHEGEYEDGASTFPQELRRAHYKRGQAVAL